MRIRSKKGTDYELESSLAQILIEAGAVTKVEPPPTQFVGTSWSIGRGERTGTPSVIITCDRCRLTSYWQPTPEQLKNGAKPEDIRFGPHCGKTEKPPKDICTAFRSALYQDNERVGEASRNPRDERLKAIQDAGRDNSGTTYEPGDPGF